ncbi:hypothetical protein J2T21_004219 [Paeniglutamicibacter psychrophenolicus]|nr:hypothetical protein [Paeniglutamicibacter psychrophenolicus]
MARTENCVVEYGANSDCPWHGLGIVRAQDPDRHPRYSETDVKPRLTGSYDFNALLLALLDRRGVQI